MTNGNSQVESDTGLTRSRYSLSAFLDFLFDFIALAFYGMSWWSLIVIPVICVVLGMGLDMPLTGLDMPMGFVVMLSLLIFLVGCILRWMAGGIARRQRLRTLLAALLVGLFGGIIGLSVLTYGNQPLPVILFYVVLALMCFSISAVLVLSTVYKVSS